MIKTLRDRVTDFFQRENAPPPITESSTLHEIAAQLPNLYDFLERKYGVPVEPEDRGLGLKEFVVKYGLPPAQIVFMEVQLSQRFDGVRHVTPRKAKELLEKSPNTRLLDVREDWELAMSKLPNSEPLTPEVLDDILNSPSKDLPLLLYCHFGVRSLDAATFLADRGFTNVHLLRGGIDAWSQEVDPSVARYENAYC